MNLPDYINGDVGVVLCLTSLKTSVQRIGEQIGENHSLDGYEKDLTKYLLTIN